jgi:hypothetical protein
MMLLTVLLASLLLFFPLVQFLLFNNIMHCYNLLLITKEQFKKKLVQTIEIQNKDLDYGSH